MRGARSALDSLLRSLLRYIPPIYIPPIKVAPLVEQLLGADAGTIKKMMTMAMVKGKAKAMVASALPPAKAALFSTGMAKLFVLELGPLLTALLLCGRIGGAYAGEVGTMQARRRRCRRRRRRRAPAARADTERAQELVLPRRLRTLGVGPRGWSLAPAAGGALFAAPLLTMLGTTIALALGGVVGARYGLVERADYWARVRAATVEVPLGLRPWHSPPSLGGDGGGDGDVGEGGAGLGAALAALLGDGARANVIALMTHPVIHHLLKVGEHRRDSVRSFASLLLSDRRGRLPRGVVTTPEGV